MTTPTVAEARARVATLETEITSLPPGALDGSDEAAATRFDAAQAELTTARTLLRRLEQRDEIARNAPARPAIHGRTERRVAGFGAEAVAVPESFDGQIMRSQDGTMLPVLEHRHRLADFTPPEQREAAELGLGGYLRSLVLGPRTDLERRVLATSPAGVGGAFIPTPLAAEVIDLARAQSVAIRAGVRTVTMPTSTLRFARITTDPIGGWRAENASIPESDPGFDSVTLSAKSWALLTRVSRELLEDGSNVDSLLRSVFGSAAALALDQGILVGSGSSNQPLGIRGMSGIQAVSMGTNGGQFTTWIPFLNAIQALETANFGNVTAAIMSPRTSRNIYGFSDTTLQPLSPPPRVANVPLLPTTSMPVNETQGTASNASSILLGDFGEVYLGLRTNITIQVLDQRYAENGQVGFVTWMRADVVAARPAALARIAGIIP